MVDSASVTEFHGETKVFMRKAESGRIVPYEFCPNCGATIRWRIETVPNRQIFAGGAFDSMGKLSVVGEMYTDGAIPSTRFGCELSRSGEPDDEFRAGLMERTKRPR